MKQLRLRTKMARVLRGQSRGVTLIEVLLALFIMGVVAIVFLSGLTVAARAVLIADIRTTAEGLARAQMEHAKAQPYITATQEDGEAYYVKLESDDIPSGYTICSINSAGTEDNCDQGDEIIAIPWDSENDEKTAIDVGLQKITLIIKHEGKVIFTLEGYKLYKGA